MGRPFALDPEIEGAVFGVLSLFVRKTPEYRAKRKEMAALHGLTERTIDNIVDRQYNRLLAMNGKGPRSSKRGPTTNPEGSVTDGSAKPKIPDASMTEHKEG